MKKYESISIFFRYFFGPDWGDSYQEIVDAYINRQNEFDNEFIEEIDDFLKHYPDNDSANPALEKICNGSMAFLHPSPVDFLTWLSAYLKQKRDEEI
ncbi:contact-dependent growth inhibition system immunity protein [Erwinia sp. AnSW2-5]|uniref:contact-dependent growth inhibition system immunity protein n=1 Tax=Erwinia sp. AnSW2-5 TaxID=3367692 RepID=UPI00385A43EC